MGVANIGVVYPKMIGDTVVGQLYECPEFIRDLTRIEEARLLRKSTSPSLARAEGNALSGSAVLVCVYETCTIILMGGMEFSARV